MRYVFRGCTHISTRLTRSGDWSTAIVHAVCPIRIRNEGTYGRKRSYAIGSCDVGVTRFLLKFTENPDGRLIRKHRVTDRSSREIKYRNAKKKSNRMRGSVNARKLNDNRSWSVKRIASYRTRPPRLSERHGFVFCVRAYTSKTVITLIIIIKRLLTRRPTNSGQLRATKCNYGR